MTVFNLYIFDRKGTCLYFHEWKRSSLHTAKDVESNAKLMYGMLYSLKAFVAKLSPVPPRDGFLNYKTGSYKLHFFETLSGLKFVLSTDLNVGDTRGDLRQIYADIFTEFVSNNPLQVPGEPVKSDLFKEALDEFVRARPYFK